MEDLYYFVEVAKRGSFTAAATAIGCTRSNVSKRVTRLEEQLGVRLLQRTTRKVTTTPQGQELVDRAVPLLGALADLRTDIITQQEQLRGNVRISAPLSYGLREVAPVLDDFAANHPRIRLEIQYSDTKVDLVGGGFDLGIRGGALQDSTLLARRLSDIRVQLCAHPDYLAIRGRPKHPDDLASHDLIGLASTLQLDDGERRVTCRGNLRIVSNNADARAQAAVRGLGIALLPDFAFRPELERVLPEWGLSGKRAFWLMQPPGRSTRRAVTALADHLVARLA